ncbi:MAG: hypothetical protein OEY41_11775 [Acidimicrobiia bacterium]|nr:hypothetical protein [Acidimicrobiia bacterium]
MSGYGPLPDGWQLEAEHFNGEGERLGIAVCPDRHPVFGDQRLLIIWDDPPSQRGSGVAAMALLDESAVTWLRAQLDKEGADDGPAE